MGATAVLNLLAVFVSGVMVGYGIRSLVSKKRRERARIQRVFFHDKPKREVEPTWRDQALTPPPEPPPGAPGYGRAPPSADFPPDMPPLPQHHARSRRGLRHHPQSVPDVEQVIDDNKRSPARNGEARQVAPKKRPPKAG